MVVYTIMFLISISFATFAYKTENKNRKIIFSMLMALPFCIVSGIRYDVGTDYYFRYVPDFNTFLNGGTVDSLELLFRILIRLSIFISSDYCVLFIITTIMIISLIFIAIYRNSKNMIMSVAIFLCASFFFESMNLVRQFISMAIILVSYKLLFKKKYIVYWLVAILIAFFFHTVSIVFLIALLLDKKVINYKILILLIIAILLLGRPLINLTLSFSSNFNNVNIAKYEHYLSRTGNLHLSTLIVEVGIYLYMCLIHFNMKKNGKELEKEGIFFINMQSMVIILTIMNIHLDLFFRVALLFSIFQILSIPYFWKANAECEFKLFNIGNKCKNNKILYEWNTILCILVILLMFSRMMYSNILKGAEEILPYKTIFERENK